MAPSPPLLRGQILLITGADGWVQQHLCTAGLDVAAGAQLDDALARSGADPQVVVITRTEATPSTARAVRAHPRAGRARIVLLLDRSTPTPDTDELAETADVILESPVSASVLVATITRQLREQEREVLVEKRYLQEVADSAPVPMWTLDDQGRCSFVNRAWLKFTGLPKHQPGADPWAGCTHPDDAAAREQAIQRAIAQRHPLQVEYRLRRHDGQYRIVEDRGLPRFTERGLYAGYIGACLDLTDQRQAQEAMHVWAQVNRGIFDGSPESITLIDAGGQILMVNRAGLNALQLRSQEQIAGRSWLSLWCEADQPEAERALASARHGQTAHFRGYAPTARGESRWWDVMLSPMLESGGAPDRLIALARDITDVKRAEEESQRLLNEQSALLESTGEGIFGVDMDGRCTFINRSALAELGYQQDEVLGQQIHRLIQHHDAEGNLLDSDACLITRTLRERRSFQADNEVLWRKDGMSFPTEYSVHPILVNDRVTGAVVAFRNIVERKSAEEERERLLAAEHAARVAAEGAVSVRNAVLTTVSHDLKNPITAIRGTAQLLTRIAHRVEGQEGQQIVEGLQHIDATTTRMVSLINELVDVARLRAGQPLELRRRSTNIEELVTPIVEATRAATERHAITLEVEGTCLTGYWDAERLERVVGNLLANAVKYSPDGGPITCRLVREPDSVLFSVRDRGVGIPADDLPFIFQPFHRAANVRDQFTGTGLGLAGAHQIIRAHDGEIWAEGCEGEGTTITFRLPFAVPELDPAPCGP